METYDHHGLLTAYVTSWDSRPTQAALLRPDLGSPWPPSRGGRIWNSRVTIRFPTGKTGAKLEQPQTKTLSHEILVLATGILNPLDTPNKGFGQLLKWFFGGHGKFMACQTNKWLELGKMDGIFFGILRHHGSNFVAVLVCHTLILTLIWYVLLKHVHTWSILLSCLSVSKHQTWGEKTHTLRRLQKRGNTFHSPPNPITFLEGVWWLG